MAHKQSRCPAAPIGKGVPSAHSNGQSKPSSTSPDHVLATPPVDDVGWGALPEWVRRRAANPKKTASDSNPDTTPEAPEFLTFAEAASVLRVSARTLRRCLADGKIPHIRVGRQVRISRKKLAEWS